MIRVHIFISGIVQGVSFRWCTQQKARELGIYGWVKNLENEKVELVAEGNKKKIEEIINWIKSDPGWADVHDMNIKEEDYKGEFNSFNINY